MAAYSSYFDSQFGCLEPSEGPPNPSMISNAIAAAAATDSLHSTAAAAAAAATTSTTSISGAPSDGDDFALFGQQSKAEQNDIEDATKNELVKVSATTMTTKTTKTSMTTTTMATTAGLCEMETGVAGELDEEGVR